MSKLLTEGQQRIKVRLWIDDVIPGQDIPWQSKAV
jgi:hypothetical protein